jgi:hypothetical protein
MPHRRLTRRQTLQAGAAAFAAAGFLRPLPAIAAPAALFELSLDGRLGKAGAASTDWRTTGALRAPRRFDMLGLRWSRADRLDAQIRTRTRSGGWSDWIGLHTMGAHAPDGEHVAGTEPVYTGPGDLFELRLRGSARGLRVRFVRAQPAARGAGRLASRGRTGRARAAHAAVAPPIIPRAAWGAEAAPPRAAPSFGQVQLAFVHHTATSNDYSPAESAGIVLGICRYHRDSNGWNDIGYNFLVDKYGQVFEGRAGGVDRPVIGAQAQGYNAASTGIACIGDFNAIAQSPAAMEALAHLIGWKLTLHGVPVGGHVTVNSAGGPSNRYSAGTPVVFERISGHRDGNNTSCPGGLLYAQLSELRARAAVHARPVPALTLTAPARRVRHPAPARVSGALRLPDGSSPAGHPLALEFRAGEDASWMPIAGAQTDAAGAFAAAIELPGSGTVRAVWPGDGTREPVASPPVALTKLSRLTLKVSSRRLRAGRVLRVRGDVAPATPDGRVVVVLERRIRGHWVGVRRRALRAPDGAYYVRLKLPVRGLYRVSAEAPGVTRRRTVRAVSG